MAGDNNKGTYCQWRTGVWRVMNASWYAAWLSYGLSAEEITVLAEYFSLLSNCLANIAVVQGESLIVNGYFEI